VPLSSSEPTNCIFSPPRITFRLHIECDVSVSCRCEQPPQKHPSRTTECFDFVISVCNHFYRKPLNDALRQGFKMKHYLHRSSPAAISLSFTTEDEQVHPVNLHSKRSSTEEHAEGYIAWLLGCLPNQIQPYGFKAFSELANIVCAIFCDQREAKYNNCAVWHEGGTFS
jgi:hypothetical protein